MHEPARLVMPLSAGTAIGPAVKPLPAVAGIATFILGIPWWAHRRRRQKVRIEHTVQAWPGMAESMGRPGSRIASETGDIWGFTAHLILRKGTTAVQAINQIPAIESGLGEKPGSVRVHPDPARADRAILRVIQKDPHAQPVPWPRQPETSISRPAEIGLFEDGRPATVLLLRRNVLIGGTTGSGKIRHPQYHPRIPRRMRRRDHSGNRPERRHGTPALGRLPAPAGHHPAGSNHAIRGRGHGTG
jgi:S-DNA-T family DNA segregation ATPase FtsK/SpoIIIE